MIITHEDPIVKEKNEAQRKLLRKANGDIYRYSRVVHNEALRASKVRKKPRMVSECVLPQ